MQSPDSLSPHTVKRSHVLACQIVLERSIGMTCRLGEHVDRLLSVADIGMCAKRIHHQCSQQMLSITHTQGLSPGLQNEERASKHPEIDG